ncbi:hypothetical protein JCM10135_06660 [Stetteria hydrogenophila]
MLRPQPGGTAPWAPEGRCGHALALSVSRFEFRGAGPRGSLVKASSRSESGVNLDSTAGDLTIA